MNPASEPLLTREENRSVFVEIVAPERIVFRHNRLEAELARMA